MDCWIDTHAHIYLKEFDVDRYTVLQHCKDLSVSRIYMPNIDHTSMDAMLEVELKFPDQCVAMMGLHPCSVKKDFEQELYRVEEWLSKRKFGPWPLTWKQPPSSPPHFIMKSRPEHFYWYRINLWWWMELRQKPATGWLPPVMLTYT